MPTASRSADGTIVAVGKDVASPADARVIEGRGETLLPGLIDSHVHAYSRELLHQALMFGVTTELDMFTDWRAAKKWKEEEAKGAYDIADFRTAGTCVTVKGGHASEGGAGGYPEIPLISGPEEAQAFVDARIAEGSDYIKITHRQRSAMVCDAEGDHAGGGQSGA